MKPAYVTGYNNCQGIDLYSLACPLVQVIVHLSSSANSKNVLENP